MSEKGKKKQKKFLLMKYGYLDHSVVLLVLPVDSLDKFIEVSEFFHSGS